jgi:hypothetical protein
MRWVLLISAIILLSSTVQAHTVYKWVDRKGIVSYSDDYDNIPPAYRDQVEIEWVHEEGSSVPSQKVVPQKSEETKTDIYGQDEAYWKGKVRPWKEFLKTAEANYDRAHEKFMGKAMELSRMRFAGRGQHRIKIIELDNAKGEMVKYADQIEEAKEGLEKILKEAREAKADPDWLK